MSVFELDIELLISLMESRPMLWDETDDNCKDRNVKKGFRDKWVLVLKKTLKYHDLITTPIIELRSIADRCAYTATWSPSLVFQLAGENRRCY
jgi:hypothetical protein